MTQLDIDQLLRHAAQLPTAERLLLANRLIQGVQNEIAPSKPQRKWKDAAGLLKYPALGEDAQTYISRSRHAEDAKRAWIIRDGDGE